MEGCSEATRQGSGPRLRSRVAGLNVPAPTSVWYGVMTRQPCSAQYPDRRAITSWKLAPAHVAGVYPDADGSTHRPTQRQWARWQHRPAPARRDQAAPPGPARGPGGAPGRLGRAAGRRRGAPPPDAGQRRRRLGKTTLVGDWLSGCGRPTAWVALDASDNDPARFWRYVSEALGRAGIPVHAQAVGALSGGATPARPGSRP